MDMKQWWTRVSLGSWWVRSKDTLTGGPPTPAPLASPILSICMRVFESHNPAGTPRGQETNGTKTQKMVLWWCGGINGALGIHLFTLYFQCMFTEKEKQSLMRA